jgi:phage-related protein
VISIFGSLGSLGNFITDMTKDRTTYTLNGVSIPGSIEIWGIMHGHLTIGNKLSIRTAVVDANL